MSAALDKILELTSRLAGAIDTSQFNELDVARAIRDGTMPSPQRFANLLLINLRVTGVGAAYRAEHDEFCWRDPSLYLNPEFLERCQGLPVILEHPPGNVLTSAEFRDRIVGTVCLPFIKDEEIWGVCKIYDAATAEMLETERLSTSPAVILRGTEGSKVRAPDGSALLIEGKPYLLDSLAICSNGVWDRGGPPAGVDNSELELDSYSLGDTNTMGCTNEELQRQIDVLRHRIGAPLCEEMRSEYVAAQSRADVLFRAFGDSAGAPPFVAGERLLQYRARLLNNFKKFSQKFKDSDLAKVHDSAAFAAVENEIYGAAEHELTHPTHLAAGAMVARETRDATGRPITRFYSSDPGVVWNKFKAPFRFVKRWGDEKNGVPVF